MSIIVKTVEVGGKTITLETGRFAKQASGSVLVSCGGTMVLVTAGASKDKREGVGFLPLTVDYQEKTSAAGRIPGGYFKREARPREHETLTSRCIDRSIRPLFPEGWFHESQIIATVYSASVDHPADPLAMIGASAALGISAIPFAGPIAGVRVARVGGELIANPSWDEQAKADLNIFMSASRNAIVMVEGGGNEISEEAAVDALLFGHQAIQPLLDAQEELQKECGKDKLSPDAPRVLPDGLEAKMRDLALPKLKEVYSVKEKLPRYAALDAAKASVIETLIADDESLADHIGDIKSVFSSLKETLVRGQIAKDKVRMDGRGLTDVRPITCEVGILPNCHGSALFTRGETQALVTLTLGTRKDEQRVEGLHEEHFSKFMLHYNFPPFSVNEAKFLRGAGRRELGHGALARRSIESVFESDDDFPYTVRILSEILESNGSSSMASVCGGSLAMFDGGAPLKKAVAGIAMGLIKEGDDISILSDILGDEDHIGDMDFKVAGTRDGINAIQMDIKIDGVSREILEQALGQAREGRLHILDEMDKAIDAPRGDLAECAPRITTINIKVDRIRDVIGPGGKVIRDIVARTGAQVDVADDGTVTIASTEGEGARRAIKMVQDLTQEAVMGKLYLGNVRKITDFGAFVEIFPGTDGLVHISELAEKRVKSVEDVLQEGDEVVVKVIGQDKGKIRLSRRQAIIDEREREQAGADAGSNAE